MVCFNVVGIYTRITGGSLGTNVIRTAMVAASTPRKTSLISSCLLWVLSPVLSQGTSSGTTSFRNLKSVDLPWTVFCTYTAAVGSARPDLSVAPVVVCSSTTKPWVS